MNAEQLAELEKPLPPSAVLWRDGDDSGMKVPYVPGYYIVEAANRIFGFGAWSLEMVELRCVNEGETTIGSNGAKGYAAVYVARARVTVTTEHGPIVRDGIGVCTKKMRNRGKVHEIAAKAAATDALKRAMVTFGNQFGLELQNKANWPKYQGGAPRVPVRSAAAPPAQPWNKPPVLKSSPLEVTPDEIESALADTVNDEDFL